MSTARIETTAPPERHEPLVRNLDDRRGSAGMWLFILTEAALFVLLFFSYYYLAKGEYRWLVEEPPGLRYSIPMLFVLLLSSVVLHWGEERVKEERYAAGQTALLLTILIGIGFLVLQYFEYRSHLQSLTPRSNAYGSIFYTIVSFHLAHLVLGMLMLVYVSILPRFEPAKRPPHRPYHDAALYWHFVDLVWIFIVGLLYVVPNLRA